MYVEKDRNALMKSMKAGGTKREGFKGGRVSKETQGPDQESKKKIRVDGEEERGGSGSSVEKADIVEGAQTI